LVGLGEGSITSKESTLAQAIMEHERFLVGKDPTDIELLWQGMFRYPRWRGGPILNSAISAVEIALWDILGKALGVPIYKLLGGAARRRIRLYKDVGGATAEEFRKIACADGAVHFLLRASLGSPSRRSQSSPPTGRMCRTLTAL
jgi:galactonate dehydratase